MLSKITTLVIALFLLLNGIYAQCVSSGVRTPTVAANVGGIGTIAWATPANVLTSNNIRTVAGALIVGDKSNYLVTTGYGFTIPSTAVICGISVTYEKGGSGLFHAVNDNSVRIVKAGVVSGSEHAIDNVWPGPDVNVTYGGAADLWGTTWTPAQINAANFGVAISADLSGLAVLPAAQIDNVRITVHYDNTLPIELLRFEGIYADEKVTLSWDVASELNNDFFTVERSEDGIYYETVGTLNGAGNSSEKNSYELEDTRTSNRLIYYRLAQTDMDGTTQAFDEITVDCRKHESLTVYPNPVLDQINILFNYSETETYTLTIFDQSGKPVYQLTALTSGQIKLDDHQLVNGLYLMQLRTENEIIASQKLVIAN